jgi:hypothetical protein
VVQSLKNSTQHRNKNLTETYTYVYGDLWTSTELCQARNRCGEAGAMNRDPWFQKTAWLEMMLVNSWLLIHLKQRSDAFSTKDK